MAGEGFTSLMATATQSQSEAAQKLARLQANQQSEALRRKQSELADKERAKQEQWNKVLENHNKQVNQAVQAASPVKSTPAPAKPKILQPQRSMTFKKLLKEAAKVDPSTFKVGPKVKIQPRIPEKPRAGEKPKSTTPTSSVINVDVKRPLPSKQTVSKPMSPITPGVRPQKSIIVERALSSSSRSVSPLPMKSLSTKKPASKATPLKSASPTISSTTPKASSSAKDAKSRLRDSFASNDLIPLAQGPRRDLRTIEEIQNDLWKKKGKNYPSVTGQSRSTSTAPLRSSSSRSPAPAVLPQKKSVKMEKSRKRARDEDDESEDSFIVSEEEEEDVPELDYRAEIRALFKRKGPTRVNDYSDDDSDMEATGFEMEREEARAARLARMEDEEEIRREEERIQEKKRRKLEGEKKKANVGK